MRFVPDNFSIAGLSAIDRRNLSYYYEKFVIRRFDMYGYGHFALACYAALPAVLTPDLLNKIWLNFKKYRWEDKIAIIHPVASTDLLLSPLVEEIGLELYEMAEPVRKALLFHLKEITSSLEKNTLGFYSLQEIAEFLRDYVQFDFTPENRDDNAFREAQEWTAMSYLDPGKAFMQVSRAFHEAATKESRAEMVRYNDALEKMSARFSINIVKDPALIPQAFQAMTSLTSVVRDLLQNQEPARLEEFEARTREAGDNVLTDTIVLDENVISIEIPGAVEEKISGLKQKKAKEKRKIRALVVGIGGYHITESRNAEFNMNNAAIFASLLTEIIPATSIELVRIMNNEATKSNILKTWEQLLRDAGENDDIIVYFSADTKGQDGHCYVICDDTDISSDNRSSWLADWEIGERAKQSNCASVTAILELDHAGTSHWLDLSDPKNIVFTASKYEDNSPSLTIPNPRGHVIFLFTWVLDKILREIKMQITNRSLFISALQEYDNAGARIQSKQDDKSIHTWEKKAPQFFCNPEAFDRFFLQGNNSRVELQSLLRQTNCYDGAITGEWDIQTANAFAASKKKYAMPDDLFRQNYIEKLKEIKKDQLNEEAVLLFVFSDPETRLNHIKEERENIMILLAGKEKALNARIELLINPEKAKLIETISSKKNRNRVKLFYYSGFDNMGDFVLKGEHLRLPEFAALLGLQENIELLVSNTCRSQYFADYVSQMGVYRAVGSEGEVDDFASANFGVDLIRIFVEGRDIDNFMEVRNGSKEILDKFVLFRAIWKQKDRIRPTKDIPKTEFKNSVKEFLNEKTKEELIGDVIDLLQSPVKNVISALLSGVNHPKQLPKQQEVKSFEKRVQEIYNSIPVLVKDDPQKNRWGSRSVNRGKKLTATVQNSPKPGYFSIRITLTTEYGERPLTGDVAFFLHPTFKEFIKYKKAMNGKAEIAIKGYSSFVVGAYTEDGTMLELDLQQVKGFPKEFYYAENEPEAGEFYTEENILGLVTKRITTKGDSVRSSLLIFRTLQQRTWLVATGKHIYVLLDDAGTRRKKDLIMTFFDKSAALPLEIRKSENFKGAMVVKFSAQDTWWYYSNALFPIKERLVEGVKQLIEASSPNYIEKEENVIASVEDIAISDSFSTYQVSKSQSILQNVETGIEQYFIVNKCIIHFDGNVITQKRLDVLNSILLAQLAADKQFPVAEQGVGWQNFFISVLNKIGWTIETSNFSLFNSSTSIFETGSAIIEIMSAAFGSYDIGIIYKALSAVRELDETQMMKDFEKNTHSSTKGLFLTAVIKEENAVAALNLNTFFLTSATEIKKILFFKSSKDTTKLEYSTCQGTLSEEIYKPVREAIITKIGERASQFMAEIVI